MDFSILILSILIIIIFFIDGMKDGIMWLSSAIVLVIFISILYYILLKSSCEYGKWIFAIVLMVFGILLAYINREKNE